MIANIESIELLNIKFLLLRHHPDTMSCWLYLLNRDIHKCITCLACYTRSRYRFSLNAGHRFPS